MFGQPVAQARVLPERLVRGEPAARQPAGAVDAFEHAHDQLGLGGELGLVRDPRRRAPLGVLGPRGGQVELAVDQRVPARRGVGQEHPQLTVVDLPGGAGVLPLHPGRPAALLDEPGVISDEHPTRRPAHVTVTVGVGVIGIAEPVQDVAAHVVTNPVDIPVRGPQQPLHPVRGHRPGVLGDRPAVLTFQTGEQTPHIRTNSRPRLRPREPRPDQPDNRVQPRHPPRKIHHAAIITARRASASHDTPQVPLQY